MKEREREREREKEKKHKKRQRPLWALDTRARLYQQLKTRENTFTHLIWIFKRTKLLNQLYLFMYGFIVSAWVIESFCNSFYLLSYSVFISILVVLQKNVVLRLSRPFGGFGSRFGLVLLVLQIESVNGGDEDGAKTGDVLPVQLFREEHEGDDDGQNLT